MREIFFRGKRIDNGEWVYGFYFCMHHDDDREHIRHFIIPLNVPLPKDKPIGEIQVEVDPKTVGQYTGVTANGKKIFEEDIVRETFISFYQTIGKIYYDTKNCQFRIEYVNDIASVGHIGDGRIYELLGNIYDTPMLLEDEP